MNRSLNAAQALERLKEGNGRYVSGLRSVESMTTVLLRRELAEKGQSPFAIILTCSDSRAPAEILFDQGLGDLFVVRVAGNVIAPSLLASIEFAAATFRTQLCVVMGHSHCGAIGAAVDHFQSGNPMPSANLKELVDRITPAVESVITKQDHSSRQNLIADVTQHHVSRTTSAILAQSPILKDLSAKGQFKVIGAVYDLLTGKAEFHGN